MYKYIIGKITELGPSYLVLECGGIGYLINVANPFIYEIEKDYKVYLYNHVREDENSLYGFKTNEELSLFLKLLNVKGIGPKMASGFFAMGSVKGIIDAINRENVLYLTKFPKVGEKIARQMILDLKGKIETDQDEEHEDTSADLIAVLESLGYKTIEIKKVIKNVNASLPIEAQVKEALKLLLEGK